MSRQDPRSTVMHFGWRRKLPKATSRLPLALCNQLTKCVILKFFEVQTATHFVYYELCSKSTHSRCPLRRLSIQKPVFWLCNFNFDLNFSPTKATNSKRSLHGPWKCGVVAITDVRLLMHIKNGFQIFGWDSVRTQFLTPH